MKIYSCNCGAALFHENTRCLQCGVEVGFCPACQQIAPVTSENGSYVCGNDDCKQLLVKCDNFSLNNVCNRFLQPVDPPDEETETLCDCCRHNNFVPNLNVEGNQAKWYRLEVAKRRLFYTLNRLGLPIGFEGENDVLPLQFSFMGDTPADFGWRTSDAGSAVFTGYLNGEITINIREADSIEREKTRIELNEPQRTLIGHMRHEVGHYYYEVLVANQHDKEFAALFGDPQAVDYGDAKDAYYKNGPAKNWAETYVSEYASMHPAEDFAETFAMFFNLMSLLDTAANQSLTKHRGTLDTDLDLLVSDYQRLGMTLNEVNRDIGLPDAVPIVLVPAVIDKIRFVAEVVRNAQPAVAATSDP